MSKHDEANSPKIGAGHAGAMFRQGLSELRGALYPSSNVAQQPQYGLYGTKTPGEVAESRREDARDAGDARELNEEPRSEEPKADEPRSILEDRLRQVEAGRDDHDREARDMERG